MTNMFAQSVWKNINFDMESMKLDIYLNGGI